VLRTVFTMEVLRRTNGTGTRSSHLRREGEAAVTIFGRHLERNNTHGDKSNGLFLGAYLASVPTMKASGTRSCSHRGKRETMAGGASRSTRTKVVFRRGNGHAQRIPCSSTAAEIMAYDNGERTWQCRFCMQRTHQVQRLTPSRVAMDQLLCFPDRHR
jgi:hypothetical protein